MSDLLWWAPPTGWESFPVRNVTAAPTAQTLLQGTGDVRIVLPGTVTGPIIIDGYTNVVIRGGSIRALPVSQIDGIDQRLIYVRNCTGVVHIEGVLLDGGVTGAETDGITANGMSCTLQVQNCRVVGLDGLQATNHADVIQTWLGLKELRVDKLTGYSDYQGIKFELTNANVMDKVTIRRTNLEAIGTDARYLYWMDPADLLPIELVDVWVNAHTTRSLGTSVWPPTNYSADPSKAASVANGRASWPGMPKVVGYVSDGPPPSGDFVPAGVAGTSYVAPGYGQTEGDTVATPPSTGLAARYRVGSIPGVAVGQAVASIPDSSGNNHPAAAQATATARPLVTTHTVAGKTFFAADFDGVDDVLALSGTALNLTRNQSRITIFVVGTTDTTAATTRYAVAFANGTAAGSARSSVGSQNNTAGSIRIAGRRLDSDAFAGVAASGSIDTTSFHVWTGRHLHAVATGQIMQDGTSLTSATWHTVGSTSDTASLSAHIGGSSSGLGNFWDGRIAEVLIYQGDIDVSAVHSYVQDEYGITVADYVAPTGPPTGTATGSWSFTGAAAGRRAPRGSASGSWSFAGAAAGARTSKGTAGGSWAFTGTAAGKSTPKGTAAGVWSYTGAAAGRRSPRGAATGAWTFTGSAAGRRTPKGAAGGSWTFTGTATGAAPALGTASGTATGTWSYAGTATGRATKRGSSTGLWTFTGTAAGSTARRGTATGTWVYLGEATGRTTPKGVAAGTWAFAGSASGGPPVAPVITYTQVAATLASNGVSLAQLSPTLLATAALTTDGASVAALTTDGASTATLHTT